MAYALGCSEAGAARAALATTPVSALWVDVEPANSWSKDPALNRAAITGFLATLLTRPGTAVGVYASPLAWRLLTGNWDSFALPEWIATGFASEAVGCPAAFADGPVWLSQYTSTREQRDHDTAC
jgi:hypothetical protein